MTEHPEFPQESPAMKYVVAQVAKIEDAEACGIGYYKSLSKVLARLDKTDIILNQLNQSTADLRKITDADIIAKTIGKRSDDMNAEIQKGLTYISDKNVKAINENLKEMGAEVKKAAGEVVGTSGLVDRIGHDLHSKMGVAIDRLDKHIKEVDERLVPPLWKIYAYTFVALLLGIAIGKWT
jgi:hypothetical protein